MKFHVKKLPSGLRILTVPMTGTEAMTLLVLVGTGSKYETKDINGISHFLEHLFFKGTKHRPEAGEVNRALDRLGSEHNAFTSKELTGYWVKAAAKYFDAALDIVSDILQDPLFKADEIEKERGVIIQEISMYEDMPQRKVAEVFEELLYGDQPAGWDIAGPKDTIRKITRDQIMDYRHRQYVATNTWVIAAGNIDPKDAEKKIVKAFARFKNGKAHPKKAAKESQIKPGIQFAYKDTDTTHVVFGTRAFDMYDKDRYALQLLSTLLGGNASSRLFMEIREKLGLAYYAKAAAQHYTDTGYLAAMVGIPHGELGRVVKKIVEIFHDIREKGFSDEEVAFAKDNLRGTLALSFESSDEIATFFGEQALFYPKIETPQDIMRRIERITARDMMKVAKEWFHPKHANLAVIGPHKSSPEFEKILAAI
ncbi:MAG: insulinase family protein, partial [Candidatus Niyogibacteria bacterium]|nr:insulinase family protein [Candidatus Niyogibacteria bacterium]